MKHDANARKGVIGERAVRNALEEFRLNDYLYCRENMDILECGKDGRGYRQEGGLDARRKLVYYTVYSTQGDKNLQTKEVDLIEEWMYADDMMPHKKAHEVKGELASIQTHKDKHGKIKYDVTDKFRPLVFSYEPVHGETAPEIADTRRLYGTGNVCVETRQYGYSNKDGWVYTIRDTRDELRKQGFNEGRDIWYVAIVYNNWQINPAISPLAEPVNNMIMLSVPQDVIIDGLEKAEAGNTPPGWTSWARGYNIAFDALFSIANMERGKNGKPIWGSADARTGARLYYDKGILSNLGMTVDNEAWPKEWYQIPPVKYLCKPVDKQP